MRLRLGIDVGGTNTDAVILDRDGSVLGKGKTPGTDDVTSDISRVVSGVIRDAGVNPQEITHAMFGTTQVTNAIVERRGLARVGIIRLGAPATRAIRPLSDWPEDIRACVGGPTEILPGGVDYDGRPISRFDEDAVRRAVRAALDDVDTFAISSVFSPVCDEDERRAAEIVSEETGGEKNASISCEIGSLGLLERENATVLNAAVTPVARRVVGAFRDALAALGIQARLYLSQNDGTLMSVEYALRYPILTIACGPTNSIRGAAFLSGIGDALVVDVGGTTTDVGVLSSGFPQESAAAVDIGSVRTNFRMPDLYSIGLGGGSVVNEVDVGVKVGPESVGYDIVREALCFGGDTLTMTDVAVAQGRSDLGDRKKVKIPSEKIEAAFRLSVEAFEDAADRMKTGAGDVYVIAVGGGSFLLPERMAGVSQVYRPEHFEVANAVGAAIAQVSATVDQIFSMENTTREEILETARDKAFEEAVLAGADEKTLEVVEIEEIPLAYMPGNAVRIRFKVAGRLESY